MSTTSSRPRRLLGFPDPVNEIAARLVAGGVVLMAVAAVVADARWLTVPLAYGFVARVLTGPRLSPLGLFVTKVVVPALPFPPRPVAGPPKRFAQGMGAMFATTALLLTYGFGNWGAAQVVLGLLVVAASLEAFVGLCLGCRIFAVLMRIGIIPESVCEACRDLSLRPVTSSR